MFETHPNRRMPWLLAPLLLFSPASKADVLVDLDAAALPAGPLVSWPNSGTLGGAFVREFDAPSVTKIGGIKGVTLDGDNDWYVGPAAPASVTANGSRSIFAWIYNPSDSEEETIFAWGRRGGPAGTDMGLNHGHNALFGAAAHWDAPDMPWSGKQENNIWTCIAYSYDAATGMAAVYTNGVLSTAKSVGPLATHAVSTGGVALPFVIGCQNGADGVRNNNQRPGAFTIARVQVRDQALSNAEITALYNDSAATFGRAPATIIADFHASTEAVYRGDPVQLDWSVSGADSVEISPAITFAPGATTATATPLETTNYTLTVAGPGGTSSQSIRVVVQPGVPVAKNVTTATFTDAPVTVTLDAEDPNKLPADLAWIIVTPPQHGQLTGTAPALTYTPDAGFHGRDSFVFKANDGYADSETATAEITVNPPPTAPSGVLASETGIFTSAGNGSFVANLQAADDNFGETHTFELVAGPGDANNADFTLTGHQLISQHDFSGETATTASIRVRVTDSGGLSCEQVLTFSVTTAPASVVINEIFYNSADNTRSEFFELHNPTGAAIDLSGWEFSSGIFYRFSDGASIPAGGYFVVAEDPAVFTATFGVTANGQYTGGLSSDGELVGLRDAAGLTIDKVEYAPEFPWPVAAGGDGASMELIHPSLDNNLAGSWRSSAAHPALAESAYVTKSDTGWRWRPGTSEASSPTSEWRQPSFAMDGTWSGSKQAPIGYGTVNNLPLKTMIGGMGYNYRCIFARKTVTIQAGEVPDALRLNYCADDGIFVWVNGHLLATHLVGAVTEPTITTTAENEANEGTWYSVDVADAASFLVAGTNVIAVQLVNTTLGSSDLGFDLELIRPGSEAAYQPTPGAANSVYSAVSGPQIRQVAHFPEQPKSSETVTITAKITDPQGVGTVTLNYQTVAPGAYIPARFPRTVSQVLAAPDGERPVNPAFENPANWTPIDMRDDGAGGDATAGDEVFTAVIPALPHRTLVRYRITAADLGGASVRVPHTDDESLNFAYFVYNGVPDYVASAASVSATGAGKIWPKALLTSVPTYHWIIRAEDMAALQAYNGFQQFPNTAADNVLAARRAEEWEGAFVYDGVVYDHVHTRLRGGNSRYGDFDGRFPNGKRHYKFQFNRGNRFQARDQNGNKFPAKWKSLAVSKMFGTKGGNSWGMPEEIGARLWSEFGVPAPSTYWFQFRVIDGAAEAPDQYNGDFWGIQQVVEEYESTFLDARGMAKGNLYKLSDWIWDADRQRRYQSADMVRDGSEFNNIRDNLHGGQTAAWLERYVDYDEWYRYSSVVEAIRDYDMFPYTSNIRHALKNMTWYFSPTGEDPTRGVCVFMPYDWDASFGPNFNNGWDHANNALYGWDSSTSHGMSYVDKPEMKIAHRNVLREFRDLIWQPDQVEGLMDHRAAVITELSRADQDRWRNAPVAAGTANDDTLAFKVQDMKNFCFTGWSAGSGPSVGPGGRAAYLDGIADNPDSGLLPATPAISYIGAEDHPIDGLIFQTGAFSDPQGSGTFAAMAWRIGQIEDPAAPGYDSAGRFIMEYAPAWQSGELANYQNTISIPTGALKPGLTYRARVRMKDSSGRWSHWSAPYQFTAIQADTLAELQENLMITEIMYNPSDPVIPGFTAQEFEYLELQNISSTRTLDLTDVRFTKGIDYNFIDGTITSLAPGQRVVVVKNLAAFRARYGPLIPVAGEWDPTDSLSNTGERLKLSFGAGVAIHDFIFDDESPWPTAPDGSGPSLQLVDPFSAPDHALAANWQASASPIGSPGNQDDPFLVWLNARGATDPSAEPVPGMSQTLIYALGADAMANPRDALPTASFTTGTDEKSHLTLSYRTRVPAPDISYIVETSTDFLGWQSGPEIIEAAGPDQPNGDGTVTVHSRVIAPVSAAPRRFIRLRTVIGE